MGCDVATEPAPAAVSGEASAAGLKLFGTWTSSYTLRVRLALKLKGLDYEYQEEDLGNKSPSLLLHNPVYKKVPVLLHDGRPLAESTVILQYIDETWNDAAARILPQDPYERAVARFWCHFVDDKLGPSLGDVFRLAGEEQKAAAEAVHANLSLLEAELREGHFRGRRFFGGDSIGLLDIVLGCGSHWLAAFEEVAAVRVVDPDSLPLFSAWLCDFEALEEVRETAPPLDQLLVYAAALRQMLLGLADPGGATETDAAASTGDLSGSAAATGGGDLTDSATAVVSTAEGN